MDINIIQPDIIWENKEDNLKQYQTLIEDNNGNKDIIILPEMFTTGFSMEPEKLSEKMNGNTINWMKEISNKYNCAITGSIIIEENNKYYNRMVWIDSNNIFYYDKRHLFRYAGENKRYTAGQNKTIINYKNWKINLMICYDLRFPVWSRNQNDYDILIYVANWPEKRSMAWKTLLQARSIENQCYTIGTNRVGSDPNGNKYSGDSSVFSPLGDLIWQKNNEIVSQTISLDKNLLIDVRNTFPFYLDKDDFDIKNY